MAYGYSEKIKNQNSFLRKPMKNLLCKNWKIVSKYRGIFRKINTYVLNKNITNNNFNISLNRNLQDFSTFFNKNGWCFIDNFFQKNVCELISKNWPKKFYFRPMKYISKQYDFGFEWNYKMKNYPKYLEHHIYLKTLYDFITSSKFKEDINNLLCNDNINRSCLSVSLTEAKEGSILFPHKDALGQESCKFSDPALNIIIFLKGSDFKEFSGGTGLYEDNEFKKTIFEPKILNNSALIYQSKKNFFHGFKEIKGRDKIRYTLNTQFTYL